MRIAISRSPRKNKKYVADVDGRKVHFGDPNYDDFTTHRNEQRKKNYISRHRKNKNWNDVRTAGFYAKNVLWNRPTISESLKDMNSRFKDVSFVLK